jgi:glutathione S-transferase
LRRRAALILERSAGDICEASRKRRGWMILYGAPNPAPNPRRVRIFLAEKGIDLPQTTVDMRKGEHKSPEILAKNSLGQVPTLVLDDGTGIAETVAICRYFEETHPEPPLFGSTAKQKAIIEMWVRRIEFQLMNPIGMVWVHAHPLTAQIVKQYRDFGESNRERIASAMRWLDRELEGRDFIAGDSYSIADICALSSVDFADWIDLKIPDDCARLKAWHARVSARPSATA